MGRLPGFQADSGSRQEPAAPAEPDAYAKDPAKRIAALFESHNRALIRFLTYRLKSAHEAKEVAQEAYVRMLQLDAPGGISYLRAFLFKTASNLAADRLKSVTRRERLDQLEFFGAGESTPSPEAGIAAEQELAVVLALVGRLPPKCRYAFIMHRCYGHDLAEIALLMHLSERMVRLYVERAVAFCREELLKAGGRNE
jgi:RNA polymerase sigma-70 factor (ECF subfamily)